MIEIESYIKGLKLTWIRRLISGDTKLKKLVEFSENIDFTSMAYTGPNRNIQNSFWKEVFEAWKTMLKKSSFIDKEMPNTCCFWNNDNIKVGHQTVYFKPWISKGILIVNDLLDLNGNFLSVENFQNLYNIRTNPLTDYGLTKSIKTYLRSLDISTNDIVRRPGPFIPNNINTIIKSKKGSKDMYNVIKLKSSAPKCEEKWTQSLNCNLDWKKINLLAFKVTKNTKFQWFQYRIIHRILGTKTLLF